MFKNVKIVSYILHPRILELDVEIIFEDALHQFTVLPARVDRVEGRLVSVGQRRSALFHLNVASVRVFEYFILMPRDLEKRIIELPSSRKLSYCLSTTNLEYSSPN